MPQLDSSYTPYTSLYKDWIFLLIFSRILWCILLNQNKLKCQLNTAQVKDIWSQT